MQLRFKLQGPSKSPLRKLNYLKLKKYPADSLQNIATPYLWTVADSALLQTIFQHTLLQRGESGTRLNKLVKLFVKFKIVYILLFFVGLFSILKIFKEQKYKSKTVNEPVIGKPNANNPSRIFVGFGAGAEETFFAAYCSETSAPVARFDQTKMNSMCQWHRVSVGQVIATLLHSLKLVRLALASLPAEFRPSRNDFLTFIGIRLGYYSYLSAWFAQLKSSSSEITEVCFLAADTAAFAAVNAGFPTRYLQHGLIRHSLVLPAFSRVDALTHDEVLHFRNRLPRATVHLARPILKPLTPIKPPCILVASIYGLHEGMRLILPFLVFASQLGLQVHVRPHPREDRSFWASGELPFSVLLDDSDASFDAALERLRPALVVSWFSTALVDALYRGLIPVSVSARNDLNIQDMVYPLYRHSLHWPSDQHELETILSDDAAYAGTLSRLRVGLE